MFKLNNSLASRGCMHLKSRMYATQLTAASTRKVTTTRIVRVKKESAAKEKSASESAAGQQIIRDPVKSSVESSSAATTSAADMDGPVLNVSDGINYFPGTEQFDPVIKDSEGAENWSTSFHGLSTQPFSREISEILMQPVDVEDIEIKPDGLLYLPEIKYRRILNKAFGPGGWGLAPRGEHSISKRTVSREYALICHGRFVSQARGEQAFFDPEGLATAAEGCKSNALMRCCKDLGIASELWDPVFIRKFKKKYCVEVWAEHVTQKKKKRMWRKKDETLEYPYKEL